MKRPRTYTKFCPRRCPLQRGNAIFASDSRAIASIPGRLSHFLTRELLCIMLQVGCCCFNTASKFHRIIACWQLSPPLPLHCVVRAWLWLRLKHLRCTSTPTRPAPFSWTPKFHRVIKPRTHPGSATLTVHFHLKCSHAVARPQQLVIGQQPVGALARLTSKIYL